MSYIDDNILPGEKILFRTKKHPIVFLFPSVLLVLALFFLTDNQITSTIYEAIYGIFRETSLAYILPRLPFIIIILVTVFWGVKQWILYTTSEYVVTDKRVIMREGFFERIVTDTRLSTISHVSIDQDLLGQALNYGTITLNNFGGTRDSFRQVAMPTELKKNVQAQLDKKD